MLSGEAVRVVCGQGPEFVGGGLLAAWALVAVFVGAFACVVEGVGVEAVSWRGALWWEGTGEAGGHVVRGVRGVG